MSNVPDLSYSFPLVASQAKGKECQADQEGRSRSLCGQTDT